MSTEDLPQSAELASAYLDGELDGPTRAAAAADPDVVAAADSMARVRAALGEIGPVDPAAKTRAIAAALAEFDALHSTSAAVIVPAATTTAASTLAPVVALQPRRHRIYSIVTGVAAAVIIAVVAVAALNSNRGSDDLASSSATEVPALAATESAPELKSAAADAGAATEAAPEATQAASAGGVADSSSTTVAIIDSPEAFTQYAESLQVAATTAAAPAGTAAPAAAEPPTAPAPGGFAAVPCLTSDQVVIGAIIYQGTSALAVRIEATGAVQAIDETDCRVLAEVPAP